MTTATFAPPNPVGTNTPFSPYGLIGDGSLLPFGAQPSPYLQHPALLAQQQLAQQQLAQQLSPYGQWGNMIKQWAPVAGGIIGGAYGDPVTGAQVGAGIGQIGGALPFSAQPGFPQQQQPQLQQALVQQALVQQAIVQAQIQQQVQQQIQQAIAQQAMLRHLQQQHQPLAPFGQNPFQHLWN